MTQTETCGLCASADSSPCSRVKGHDGPHGFEVFGGTILGPWWQETTPLEPTWVRCDSCTAPMMMRRGANGDGDLECTKCEQRWHLSHGGYATSTVTCFYGGIYTFKDKLKFGLQRMREFQFRKDAELALGISSRKAWLKDWVNTRWRTLRFILSPFEYSQ